MTEEKVLVDSDPVCCTLLHWTSTLAMTGYVYNYNALIFCFNSWELMEGQTYAFCLRLNAVIFPSS